MDIGVKERVIGAVVLVVLGIIIIPWALQGPAPDSSVTQNVSLPAASTTAAPREYRMELAAGSAQPATSPPPAGVSPGPMAAAAPGARPQAITTPAAAPPPVANKAQPIARPTAAKTTLSGDWMVQAGSYSSERNALKLQKSLEQHGYHVQISRYSIGKTTYYRVRVGPYKEHAAAAKVVPAINHIYGGKAKVVPNA